MTRLSSILAVAAFAVTAISFHVNEAQAYCRSCAVGAGVIGGLAAGAIIGSAIANSQAQAAPGVAYAPPPPPPDVAPADLPEEAMDSAACHIEKQQMWDGRAWRWSNVEVCE